MSSSTLTATAASPVSAAKARGRTVATTARGESAATVAIIVASADTASLVPPSPMMKAPVKMPGIPKTKKYFASRLSMQRRK
ncbi:MAG: hypothetical protein A2X49_01875 [Lentisphaerae bacterium GWF2_52_8]|nr:MAG: hypothetical protein A2X49_01875 [Lentisphaerae bacterium GWF2_52_8]